MSGDTAVLEHYLAPLRRRLEPTDVTELVVNRPGEFAVETHKGWTWYDDPELTEASLRPLAIAAAAVTTQDVSRETPICSTVLPSGERCQIVLPPAAEHISITLRKPSERTMGMDDFTASGLFESVSVARPELRADETALLALRDAGDWPAFFAAAVRSRKNILISGATGSGKTTFAKGLIQLNPRRRAADHYRGRPRAGPAASQRRQPDLRQGWPGPRSNRHSGFTIGLMRDS